METQPGNQDFYGANRGLLRPNDAEHHLSAPLGQVEGVPGPSATSLAGEFSAKAHVPNLIEGSYGLGPSLGSSSRGTKFQVFQRHHSGCRCNSSSSSTSSHSHFTKSCPRADAPLELLVAGMRQLQEATRRASATSLKGDSTETINDGPVDFQDRVYSVSPALEDISDNSAIWWNGLLDSESQSYAAFLKLDPVSRLTYVVKPTSSVGKGKISSCTRSSTTLHRGAPSPSGAKAKSVAPCRNFLTERVVNVVQSATSDMM